MPYPQKKQNKKNRNNAPIQTPQHSNQATEVATFPMRINRYMAWKKHSTRKEADVLISKKHVYINGRLAVLGDKVHEHDVVDIRGSRPKKYTYVAYHKPRGVITHSPERGEIDIIKAISKETTKQSLPLLPRDLFPVGRLDKDSSGLIILTNDGRITDALLNPAHDHDKEYEVTTKKPLRDSFKANMERGVTIEEEQTQPCTVRIIDEYTFRVILHEGKKHQIRRMVVALHNEVDTLKRIRIMNIHLDGLPVGGYRILEGEELKTFLMSLGMR